MQHVSSFCTIFFIESAQCGSCAIERSKIKEETETEKKTKRDVLRMGTTERAAELQ